MGGAVRAARLGLSSNDLRVHQRIAIIAHNTPGDSVVLGRLLRRAEQRQTGQGEQRHREAEESQRTKTTQVCHRFSSFTLGAFRSRTNVTCDSASLVTETVCLTGARSGDKRVPPVGDGTKTINEISWTPVANPSRRNRPR